MAKHLRKYLFLVVFLVVYDCLLSQEQVRWSVQQRNVCFETRDNKFGTFSIKYTGPLVAIKLFHKSGYVSCSDNLRSYWGCGRSPGVSIAITDEEDNIIFPRELNEEGWVHLPGYDGRTSKAIILNDSALCEVREGMMLRLWFGEDLRDFTEIDNSGRSCVDVYSRIIDYHDVTGRCAVNILQNKILPKPSVITSSKELTYISDIISVIVGDVDNTMQVMNITEKVIESYSTLLETEAGVVAEAEKANNTATSLVKDMEKFARLVGQSVVSVGSDVTVSTKNIGIHVAKVAKRNVKICCHLNKLSQVSVAIDHHNKEITSNFLASVDIPSSAFKSDEEIVYSQAYLKSTLFVDKEQISGMEKGISTRNRVQSLVLSISIGTNASPLEDPIILRFKKRSSQHFNSTCVFWVFSDDVALRLAGRWSSSGCTFVSETADRIVTCRCHHLTNFAVLMDVHPTTNSHLSLHIFTWIGCIISLIGLLITILVFSLFPNLRAKLPSKILLCLCSSLALLLLVFIVGVERSESRITCQVIAGILHYFLMTSFAWMGVTAATMFQLLVLVFRSGNEEKYFLRVSVFAWVFPFVIVLVTALIAPNQLGNQHFCFPQGVAAYFGVLLPIAVVLGINFFVLVSIALKFRRSRPVGDIQEQRKNVNHIRISLTVTVLFGLTWLLGVFAIEDAEFVFELLFCIFNSLQGFFIFILHTVTNNEVQKEVKHFIQERLYKRCGVNEEAKQSTRGGVAFKSRSMSDKDDGVRMIRTNQGLVQGLVQVFELLNKTKTTTI